EAAIIRREVAAMLDSVIMCGNGSVAEGIVRAFRDGLLDVPFSPSIYNRGLVMTARDCDGAVRFASPGNLAFDAGLKQFHREKMQDRRHAEGILTEAQDYLLVEKDVLRVARGEYESWPLKR
ncbi:MAG: methylaspartate mutase subunit E, partial [Polyangiaceae bacterium]